MLNQERDRRITGPDDWCVGEPPVRWDVSFGARLAEKLKQIFWRDGADRQASVNGVVKTVELARKAA